MNDEQNNHEPKNSEVDNLSLEELALMASDEERSEEETQETQESEPSVVATEGNTFDRVGVKTLLIGGTTSLVILTVALMGQGFTDILSNKQEKPPKIAQQPKNNQNSPRTGNTKPTPNIPSQTAQLEKLNSKISNPSPAPTPTKPLKVPKTTALPVVSTPPIQKLRTTVRPKTRYIPAPFPASKSSLVAPNTEPMVIPLEPAKPQPLPVKVQPQIARLPDLPEQTQPQREDEVIALEPATSSTSSQNKVGKETVKEEAEKLGDANDTTQPANETEEKQEDAVHITVNSTPEVHTQTEVIQHNGQSFVVGTFAEAKLESAIVWNGKATSFDNQPSLVTALKVNKDRYSVARDNQSQNRTFPVKLTEPLKNLDGTVVIPKNSLLIAQVQSITDEGWLELSVVSIVTTNESGYTVEKTVPSGAILVQTKDGSPLRAEIVTPEYKNDTKADYPKTARLSRLPVRHGILLDDEEPEEASANKKVEILRQALERRKRKTAISPAPVLTLDKGTQVRIYINRSFSLRS
jgi:hypothetical protein